MNQTAEDAGEVMVPTWVSRGNSETVENITGGNLMQLPSRVGAVEGQRTSWRRRREVGSLKLEAVDVTKYL